MSSYLSSLVTTTTSRYNSLRRALLDNEADGDTEDDSHISRVLRAYYTEKGRPFPPWLPPDPKAPQLAPTQFVSSSGRQPGQPGVGRGGGLSDLWDSPQQPQQQQPMSLRRGAQGRGAAQVRPGTVDPYNAPGPAPQGRPLPSQRAGSYQTQFASSNASIDPSPPPSSSSGATAQERLKARLWGAARAASPALSSSTSASNPSLGATPSPGLSQLGSRNPYDRSASPLRGQTASPYSDQGGRAASPYSSANSPWSSTGDGYSTAGGDGAGRSYGSARLPGRERIGLPSGPRPR